MFVASTILKLVNSAQLVYMFTKHIVIHLILDLKINLLVYSIYLKVNENYILLHHNSHNSSHSLFSIVR